MSQQPDLPDFDTMLELAGVIRELMLRKADLDSKIKVGMANTYKRAMSDKNLFENGKPPSVAYVKAVWEFTGIDDELIPLRMDFGVACADLDFAQNEFDIMKTKIDIYRTESANKRASL